MPARRPCIRTAEAGKLRAIGLSNFGLEDTDNILDASTVKPM
jgi:diketogulonate reductase-like aldo/keto reductase